MITYNKEQGAWDFRQATEDEKEEILRLGEAMWAQAMANSLAKKWMEEEQAHMEQAFKEAKAMGMEDSNVIEFPSKH